MITTDLLKQLSKFLKVTALCDAAGINKNTVRTKLARGQALTTDESIALEKALNECGLFIKEQKKRS